MSRVSALLPIVTINSGQVEAAAYDGNQNEVVKEFYTLMLEASRRRESLACNVVSPE